MELNRCTKLFTFVFAVMRNIEDYSGSQNVAGKAGKFCHFLINGKCECRRMINISKYDVCVGSHDRQPPSVPVAVNSVGLRSNHGVYIKKFKHPFQNLLCRCDKYLYRESSVALNCRTT